MEHYFGEKSHQVEYGSMKSFGIEIDSRYSKAEEISEMLNFTTQLALQNIHLYVQSVFYDSNANLCTFIFSPELKKYSSEAQNIEKCALKTISQFDFFGSIGHGIPLIEKNI